MPVTMSGMSGFDFGALADALMQLERAPLSTLQIKKEDLQSRKAMWGEISSALKKVRDAAEVLGKPKSLSLTKATSARDTQLGISASNTAALGTYQVTVHQLATTTRVTSGFATQLGLSRPASLDQPLNSAAAGLGGGYTSGYLTINGTRVAVNLDPADPDNPTANDTVQDVLDRINSQVAGVTASYDADSDRIVLTSASPLVVGAPDDTSNFLMKAGLTNAPDTLDGGDHVRSGTRRLGRLDPNAPLASASLATALSGAGSFEINGETISYDASTDSLNDVLNRINRQVPGVSASYDAQADKIVLSSKTTGSLGITRGDTTGNFLAAAGLLDSGGDSQAATQLGQNAAYQIAGLNNGAMIYSTTNTVDDAIAGVTLTLREAAPDSPIEVTVARDSSDLKAKLQAFVSAYNEAINLVSTRLTEEPLANASTQATRRPGLLRGDTMLSNIRNALTASIVNTIGGLPGDFNRLGNLGVSISSTDYKTGTLSFDEARFDKTVNANYQQAYDILFRDEDGDGIMDAGETGAIPRMLAALDKLIDPTTQDFGGVVAPRGTIANRSATLDREIQGLDQKSAQLELQFALREQVMRAKFLAAETALSQLQSMGNSLGGTTLGIG